MEPGSENSCPNVESLEQIGRKVRFRDGGLYPWPNPTHEEEKATDEKLTEISKTVNQESLSEAEPDEEDDEEDEDGEGAGKEDGCEEKASKKSFAGLRAEVFSALHLRQFLCDN
jgi:hypothetical protein